MICAMFTIAIYGEAIWDYDTRVPGIGKVVDLGEWWSCQVCAPFTKSQSKFASVNNFSAIVCDCTGSSCCVRIKRSEVGCDYKARRITSG
jgi:hypothetical protein